MSTRCKRCGAEKVYWEKSINGKWTLFDENTARKHFCADNELKAVKCKYCTSSDLHWAEEVDPISKGKKMVLTESYGLPHACDERIAFMAKEKQNKKDKYEAEKKRINEHPDGTCPVCKGSGYSSDPSKNSMGVCGCCVGTGSFSYFTRKNQLALIRYRIWPNMRDKYVNEWEW